jgi:hypothetical protein
VRCRRNIVEIIFHVWVLLNQILMTVHYNMLVYQVGLADMQNKLYAAIYALHYAKLSKIA